MGSSSTRVSLNAGLGALCEPRDVRDPRDDGKLTSGGSSPSREVQQIMSHNDDIYKPHLEDESSQTPVAEEDSSSVIQNGTDPVYGGGTLFAETSGGKLTHSGSDTSWPQISLAQITEANQRKASSDKSSSQSLNNSLNVSAGESLDLIQ
ncbi:uncharacterized protein LOC113234362 [Hyposmocoma kahamanoa]|uniref:uncharacterized protein LOC113234362 n=1 Tax=Hyposmocoma kahamanoa TaxID=1477025 RepID=UPI000E6D8B93|nr:uncharacterized protein LOC113234362 [Hyposmocoma kahamanoa]